MISMDCSKCGGAIGMVPCPDGKVGCLVMHWGCMTCLAKEREQKVQDDALQALQEANQVTSEEKTVPESPRKRRSARFQVSWVDDFETHPDGAPEDRYSPDYIVLELLNDDVKRLYKQLEMVFQFEEAGGSMDGYLAVLLHGKAHPQRADSPDGTTSYPSSLLSDEVLSETPRMTRWKP